MAWVENLTTKEINEWIAFYTLNPFGEERMDLRFALMTAHLLTPHIKKGHKPKLSDYMINFEPKRQMTPEEIRNVLKGITNG